MFNEACIIKSSISAIFKQKLQEQLTGLQQNVRDMNLQNERLQREIQQYSNRIQELTRQLRETQTNCDSIASQRDILQSKLEQVG